MTYNVTVEYEDGYTDTVNFCVLKFAQKWMEYMRSRDIRGMIAITLECIA